MEVSAAIPTFVVTLREGVEAALVVGIVLAYLKKADQARLNPWVYAGVGVGLVASVLVGVLFKGLLLTLEMSDQVYAPVVKQILEGGFSVVAIVLLSWMLVWMTQQARFLKAEVEGAITTALQQSSGAGWGVFGLVMIAVLREGFETVLFIAAKFQEGWMPTIGAVAGLLGAVAIGVLLFQLGVKINLRLFFQVMGILLLLIVSGLVVTALRHFDQAIALLAQINPDFADLCPDTSASCILGPLVWNTSGVLPDRQFPGILLKAFFGYTQTLYLAQAIGYLLFLGTIGGIYLQSLGGGLRSLSGRSDSPT
ncbi:MAG: FTR1 family iron permease [Cyanobacteria bacterium CRU_2_1]|nr:FTR1 family iron permease [Cyanobacteria bacterium RU_5_0]NJR59039.1 FTR1 family iron permease [Cyanobacteria bacterium CRU_2_1]